MPRVPPQRARLDDGSTLELNAASAVRVQFTASERHVQLEAGEAHFAVAHDTARPFIVSAGGILPSLGTRGAASDSVDGTCQWSASQWARPISAAELVTASSTIGRDSSTLLTGGAFTDTAVKERGDLDEFGAHRHETVVNERTRRGGGGRGAGGRPRAGGWPENRKPAWPARRARGPNR